MTYMFVLFGLVGTAAILAACIAAVWYFITLVGKPHESDNEWDDDWQFSTTPLDTEAEDDAEVEP
jgi:hypothetical protein